jgi:tetratricopeptide (TPR) repeat protein
MLEGGVRGEDLARVRALLALPEELDEVGTVAALVKRLAYDRVAAARWPAAESERAEREDPSRVVDVRASFLVRLTAGGEVGSVDIERLAHAPTLLAILRAGNLMQRRAAASRLHALLQIPKSMPAPQLDELAAVVPTLRTLAIAYEVSQICERLPGQAGRAAQATEKQWHALLARVEHAIHAFWDGESADEPLRMLGAEDRAHLLSRVRDLPDEVVRHIAAVITGNDGAVQERERAVLLEALQSAGDYRLLPALRSLIERMDGDRMVPAARALARIDDPRVHPILRAAFLRTAIAEHRLVLAGALGIAGDTRGASYARETLATQDARLLPYALEALAYVGGTEDVQAVAELLDHSDPERVRAAVETLGRIGNGRALLPLARLCAKPISSALRADAEEAEAAIRARLDLLGEEPPALDRASQTFDTAKMAAIVRRRRDPAVVRMRAWLSVMIGHLWLTFGAHARAIARLEAAAVLRPDWVAPVVTVAKLHARRSEYAQALSSFRRALEIDRTAIERSGTAVELMAQSFLRRAEAVAAEGRADVARGLVEEALVADLRKAPSGLRFALTERLAALRIAGTP